MSSLRNIFDKRADELTDHDPWRYGEELSYKADMAELEWVTKHMEKGNLLDIGCGTGRHDLELARLFPESQFDCFDCAQNNIRILDKKITETGTKNVTPSVCDAVDMSVKYSGKRYQNLLSIGLIQYLDDEQLVKHFRDSYQILDTGGVYLIKHPTAYKKTFIFDGYSDLLESRYVSKYRNFQDIINLSQVNFEVEKIEQVFTLQNLTQEELAQVEKNEGTRQMWFLLRKVAT